MKIIHIIPGSGGTFYCQNCLRDSSLVRALQQSGHSVTMVPMYLPLLTDESEIPESAPVFFGGINVYLQEKFSAFRKTPRWLDRIFDSSWMLRMAAKNAGSTDAAGLEDMTLSMLMGPEGRQAKELDRLLEWLRTETRPDIIHISNALLLGLAGPLHKELGARIVCSLQDENVWIDAMRPEYRQKVWDIISEKSRDVDAFVTVSDYYRNYIHEQTRIAEDKIHLTHIGLTLDKYGPAEPENPTIGFLTKITPESGFNILFDAFSELKKQNTIPGLKLRATGGITGPNTKLVQTYRNRAAELGFGSNVEFIGDFSTTDRIEFLRSLSLLSVPIPAGEALGMFMLEAMACGVPVVQPDAGAFREVVNMTGGGIIYTPNNSQTLAQTISSLLQNPEQMQKLSSDGQSAVSKTFGMDTYVEKTLAVYASL